MAASRSTLQATSTLASYLGQAWPGLQQVCRITRRRMVRGKESVETVYAITSLTAQAADTARLLVLSRSYWGIENRLHYMRDVTCREDQCRTRSRAAGVSGCPILSRSSDAVSLP